MKIEGNTELEKSLGEAIEKFYSELQESYSRRAFGQMAEMFAKYCGVLVSPEGERLHGRDCLVRFWRQQRETGVTDVIFEPIYAYIADVKNVVKRTKKETEVTQVAHHFAKYRLISRTETDAMKNTLGSLALTMPHQDICVWEP